MKKLSLIFITLSIAMDCLGWGQKGHDVTCAIAERHLTDKAKTRIAEILDGKSMIYWSNWLDNAVHTSRYAYAKTWHYKNIEKKEKYDSVEPFKSGDVVSALEEQTRRLKDLEYNAKQNKELQALALKMLIHLMGDLHQPMHMGRYSDLGGNQVKVYFFEQEEKLHNIWDSRLIETVHKWSYTEWCNQLDRVSEEQYLTITSGIFNDWGRETHAICCMVYDETPEDTKVSFDYIERWRETIEEQLLRGGLRLAKVLNEVFK